MYLTEKNCQVHVFGKKTEASHFNAILTVRYDQFRTTIILQNEMLTVF